MTEKELMDLVDRELDKSQNLINALEAPKTGWIEQSNYAKKAIKSQQLAIAALTTLIKGAMQTA